MRKQLSTEAAVGLDISRLRTFSAVVSSHRDGREHALRLRAIGLQYMVVSKLLHL